MITVTTNWRLTLEVKSSSESNTKALANALATDESVEWHNGSTSFSFSLNESKAKDLRAMWNTRIRGLIAADEILQAIESAGSSTKDDSKDV